MAPTCPNITDLLQTHYLSPMYALEFAIGFPCNLFVVLFYVFWLPTWKSINVYMFNLAISDLIFLCTLPALSYNYLHNQEFPLVGCVVTRYILHVNLYASILFMVWVGVDRLILLWYPQRNHFLLSCKASLLISFLNWIWVTIEITPLIVFVMGDLKRSNWTKCNDFASMKPSIPVLCYSLLLTTVAYVLPLLTLFLLTSKMISQLKEREQVLGTSFQRPVNILKTVAAMGLASNCSNITDLLQTHYLSPMYALEFAIGFPCNLFVVLFYVFWLPTWKSINVYIFNLAISDLICLCNLPVLSYNYLHNQDFPPVGCVITRYILHVNLYASILFMVCVGVDRLILLWYPQRNHFLLSCKASLLISFLNWILMTIENAPLIMFVINDQKSNKRNKCNDFGSMQPTTPVLIYCLLLTTVAYVLPLLTLFLLTSKMISYLKEREEVLGTSFQRPVNILKTALVMTLVLYMPIHLMRNMRLASQLPGLGLTQCTNVYIEAVYIISRPIAFSHSVINPVFYVLMTERFREVLQDKWRTFGYLTICRRLS
ncbi:succinate receptor 1-like [Clarias magur]|uniref:Succinate receptor 1-like n=1 Tax=Clarias magur TaxID=1594786 RepID=A0A8J4TBF8_CLAMG|nr:succinate receptor 1-like [Clarias magur]